MTIRHGFRWLGPRLDGESHVQSVYSGDAACDRTARHFGRAVKHGSLPPALAHAVPQELMCLGRCIRRGELAPAEAPGRAAPGTRRSLAGTVAREEPRLPGQSARGGGPSVLDDASTGNGP